MNAHYEALVIMRDEAQIRLDMCQIPGTTLEEYRVLRRKLEHLNNQLKWFEMGKGMIQ